MDSTRIATTLALFLCVHSSLALAGEEAAADRQLDEVKAFHQMFGQGPQEEDFYKTDRLLVTATGSQKPVHLAPSVASVITAEDIENIGATTLDEALETVPGLHVEPSSSAYFSSIWSVRGIHTSINPQVLMLINGVPFTDSYQGGRPLTFRMPVAMISRIEVLRGPGSALYGADAFAGVVNVITKDNFEINGTQAGARYGSFDSMDGWVQHGGQYGGWDLALGVEWQKSSADHDQIIARDKMQALGLAAFSEAPGPLDSSYDTVDSHLTLRRGDWDLHLYGALQENNLGPGAAQTVTAGNDNDSKFLLTDLGYSNNHSLKDWTLGGRLYYQYLHLDTFIQYYPPTPLPAASALHMVGDPIHMGADGGIEVNGLYTGVLNHQLRLATGLKNYDFDRDQYKNFLFTGRPPVTVVEWFHVTDDELIFITKANRNLWYGLAQDEWQLARAWTLTAGVRYDEYSDFGTTINPRAALVWETRYDLTTKLMYGTAFRAPSFSEQFVKNNPVVIGNPSLAPEEIETAELAFDYQPTKDLRLILSLFTYEATDVIEQTPITSTTAQFQYANYGSIRGQGLELEGDWQIVPSLRVKANLAYQRARNTTIDTLVTDAPGLQYYLNPRWEFMPDWSLDGQYLRVADRHRAKADPRDAIADYDLVNLILRRKNIAKHWEAAVSLRNLFDEDARIPSTYDPAAPAADGAYIPEDYPLEGRAVWAEVRCHF